MSATDIDAAKVDRAVAGSDHSEPEVCAVRVFVTGASGWIGSAVVAELIEAGHEVAGLARSDAGAAAVHRAGAEVVRGSLEDLDVLRSAAAAADGVIHTAYIHDFSQMEVAAATDLRVVEALGAALEGSGRPLVVTTGVALANPGGVATEESRADPENVPHPRVGTEFAAFDLAERGVRTAIVRPAPSVHGEGDKGFVPILIGIARERGVAAYIGDGANRWPAVHRRDIAAIYRLALEHAPAGSVYHGVAEEGVPTRQIAEVIGRHLDLPATSIAPEQAAGHFGWMGAFFGLDCPASSALTREQLGWTPTHPGLIEDLEAGHYFAGVGAGAR
jgi:nucleoside-diphosphate-sugar epimerase